MATKPTSTKSISVESIAIPQDTPPATPATLTPEEIKAAESAAYDASILAAKELLREHYRVPSVSLLTLGIIAARTASVASSNHGNHTAHAMRAGVPLTATGKTTKRRVSRARDLEPEAYKAYEKRLKPEQRKAITQAAQIVAAAETLGILEE